MNPTKIEWTEANPRNLRNMFHSGYKILCDGYVIVEHFLTINILIINDDFM